MVNTKYLTGEEGIGMLAKEISGQEQGEEYR